MRVYFFNTTSRERHEWLYWNDFWTQLFYVEIDRSKKKPNKFILGKNSTAAFVEQIRNQWLWSVSVCDKLLSFPTKPHMRPIIHVPTMNIYMALSIPSQGIRTVKIWWNLKGQLLKVSSTNHSFFHWAIKNCFRLHRSKIFPENLHKLVIKQKDVTFLPLYIILRDFKLVAYMNLLRSSLLFFGTADASFDVRNRRHLNCTFCSGW